MGLPQLQTATELARALAGAARPANAAQMLVDWLAARAGGASAVLLLDGDLLLAAGDSALLPSLDVLRAYADACDWPDQHSPQPADAGGFYCPIFTEDNAYGVVWTSALPPDETALALGLMAARLHHLRRLDSGGRVLALQELSLVLHLLPSDEGWQVLGEQLRTLFAAPSFYVGLLDGERGELQFPLAYEDGYPITRQPERVGGLAGLVLRYGTPLSFDDLPNERDRLAALGLETSAEPEDGLAAWLGVPLRGRNHDVLGLIGLQAVLPNTFDEQDLLALLSVAAQVVLAVESALLWEAERERRTVASVLTDVNRVMSATLHYDEVLELILEQLRRVVDYDTATILLPPSGPTDGSRLVVSALQGPEPEQRGRDIAVTPDSAMMRVYRSQQPLLLDNLSQSPLWLQDGPAAQGGLSWMAAPLLAQERVIGILTVEKQSRGAYSERDVSTVFALASHAAIAVENARLHAQAQASVRALQERSRRQTSLSHINAIVTSTLDLDTILGSAAQLVTELFQIDHCAIALLDNVRGDVRICAEFPDQGNRDYNVALEQEFHTLVRYNTVIVVADTRAEGQDEIVRALLQQTHARSALVVPLSVRDRNIGLMTISTVDRLHGFNDDERETFMTVAGQVALAVHNAELYQQAVAASRLKSEFLATMSHELRTPLNAILGYSDLLLEQSYGELNERQTDRLQRLNASGRRLLALINDVLDLSKIEAGQMDLRLTPMRVSELLAVAVSDVKPRADAKGLPVNVAVDPDEQAIFGDPDRLRQVILNLLDNAVKFTHSGEVTLMVTRYTHNGRLASGAVRPPSYVEVPDGEWVALSVRDTGIGIRPEHQRLVFDAFRQVDGSMARQFEGTGLGLAITQQLVALHHGFLWVDSEPGRGSTFTVLLPALPDSRADQRASDRRPAVLMLEGDSVAFEHLRATLDEADYQVVSSSNPAALIDLSRRTDKAVVVVTPSLMGIGGLTLLYSLRKDPTTRTTPTLLMLAGETADSFFLLRAVDYLRTPLERDAVMAAVGQTLRTGTREPILIVDDNAADRGMLDEWLSRAGYRTASAVNADGALLWLKQWPAALILVNALLPNGDAFKLLYRLNDDNFTASIPLIVLYPHPLDEAAVQAIRSGVTLVLQQPGALALSTIEAVQTAVQQRRLRERQLPG